MHFKRNILSVALAFALVGCNSGGTISESTLDKAPDKNVEFSVTSRSSLNSASPRISGTDTPSNVVMVKLFDKKNILIEKLKSKVDSDGKWSVDIKSILKDGFYNCSVESFGNGGVTARKEMVIEIDTVLVLSGGLDRKSDANLKDNITNIDTPTFSGKGETSTNVTLDINGNKYKTSVDRDGNWSITVNDALPNGTFQYIITTIDFAKNKRVLSGTIKVDSQLTLIAGLDNAPHDSTVTTNNPSISGKGVGGDTITISILDNDNKLIRTVTPNVGDDGVWSVDVTGLENGNYTYKVESNDLAGNSSVLTEAFIVDAPPEIIDLSINGDLIALKENKAVSSCANCESKNTEIKWVIDSNFNRVFGDEVDGIKDRVITTSEMTMSGDETGARVQLTAIPIGVDGEKGKALSKVFYRANAFVDVFSNSSAFAALRHDGSLVTWGNEESGGNAQNVDLSANSPTKKVFSSDFSFAAQKQDGSVATWGDATKGGDSSGVNLTADNAPVKIVGAKNAYAAIKQDGSVVTWGDATKGGDSSGVDVTERIPTNEIVSSNYAFAALKQDGSVVSWGYNGEDAGVSGVILGNTPPTTHIVSADLAFAALRQDGSVVTWGSDEHGGDSSGVDLSSATPTTKIVSADRAFAALKQDGSVVTWGMAKKGGDSSSVDLSSSSPTVDIASTDWAFAALKADGSVVTWGEKLWAGDSSSVDLSAINPTIKIAHTNHAFAAIKKDGSVVTWGDGSWGGDSSSVDLSSANPTVEIFANNASFAALKLDGSVVTWGDVTKGGDSSSVDLSSANPTVEIFTTDLAFTALKADGSLVTWGSATHGGDSSQINVVTDGVKILSE